MEPATFETEERPDEEQGGRFRGWRIRIVAAILLVAILCGVVTTPAVFFYRWYDARQQTTPAAETSAQQDDRPEVAATESGAQPAPDEVESDPTPTVQRIAFITSDQRLATIRSDGSQRQLLTDTEERFQFPAWSPNGSQVAVIGGDSVYVIEVAADGSAAGALQPLYEDATEPPFYLYWSPDGQAITFLANHPDGIALHLAGVNGGADSSRLLSVGQPFYWDWLPDSDQILIHSGFAGDDARLALLNPDDADTLEELGNPGFFQAPGVSANGDYWAYAELNEQGDSRLVVVNAAGDLAFSEPHLGQLTLSWSPHDNLLAFTSPTVDSAAFYGPLQLFEPESQRRQTLSDDVVIAYFWSPDGSRIAYVTLPNSGDGGVQAQARTYRTGLSATAEPVRPVQMERPELDLWIVEVSSGRNRRIGSFEPTNLFISQFLPFFDQYALSHQIWSADSERLVLPILLDGRSQIVAVSVSDGTVSPIAEGLIGFWRHQ